MLLFRSTPRAKQVERDISHDARTAADTARSSHAWIRTCRQLRMCTPKRGLQVHEALEFFLCESFAKHGERCRIWEAERFSTAERIALGVGRTRVRDEAEPLHDEALSGGGAIFFVVTCSLIVGPIAQLPFPWRPQYRDLVRMGVTLPCQSSRLSHYVHSPLSLPTCRTSGRDETLFNQVASARPSVKSGQTNASSGRE